MLRALLRLGTEDEEGEKLARLDRRIQERMKGRWCPWKRSVNR